MVHCGVVIQGTIGVNLVKVVYCKTYCGYPFCRPLGGGPGVVIIVVVVQGLMRARLCHRMREAFISAGRCTGVGVFESLLWIDMALLVFGHWNNSML